MDLLKFGSQPPEPDDPIRDLMGLGGSATPPPPPSPESQLNDLTERYKTPIRFGKSPEEIALDAEIERTRREKELKELAVGDGSFNQKRSMKDYFEGFALNNGYYTPSRYDVSFDRFVSLPSAREKQDLITFQCTEVSFPGKNFRSAEARTYGPIRRPVIDAEFNGEITLTFRVGREFKEVKMFENWMNYISSPTNNYNVSYYDDYICNMFVDAVDKDGRTVLYRVRLNEVYPKALDSISLGAARMNEVSTVNVTFAYRNWVAKPRPVPDPDISKININSREPYTPSLPDFTKTNGPFKDPLPTRFRSRTARQATPEEAREFRRQADENERNWRRNNAPGPGPGKLSRG